MEAAHLLAFNAALLAAVASPGPALLHAMRATLAGGRAAGVATGAGLAAMASAWTLPALLGLDGVFRLVPPAYAAFKVAGTLYLLWIAWTIWRAARRPLAAPEVGGRRRSLGRAALGGAAINLANPKSVLFAAAVLVVIFPPDLGAGAMAAVVLNHLVLELAFYALLAAVLSRPAMSRIYLRAKPLLDRIAASLMVALGLRLLLDRT